MITCTCGFLRPGRTVGREWAPCPRVCLVPGEGEERYGAGAEAHAAHLAEYLPWSDLIFFLLGCCREVRCTPIASRGQQCPLKCPSLPFSYLESSRTGAGSPLLQNRCRVSSAPRWAGHCLQMSSTLVGGSLGPALSSGGAPLPFLYTLCFMACACEEPSRGRGAVN